MKIEAFLKGNAKMIVFHQIYEEKSEKVRQDRLRAWLVFKLYLLRALKPNFWTFILIIYVDIGRHNTNLCDSIDNFSQLICATSG